MAGSNDLLLEQTIGMFNSRYPQTLAVFGNLGSMGGISALKQGLCHIATSHLLQENDQDFNFEYAGRLLDVPPVIVNFCKRNQGLIVSTGNPRGIRGTADLAAPGLRLVNRKLGTGTRHLFDRELKAAGLSGRGIAGYEVEVLRHMDVGLAVLSGRADAGPGIQPVAELLGLGFVPWLWERYDLLIPKEHFFQPAVQNFLGLLHEAEFQSMAQAQKGYDVSESGKMLFHKSPLAKTNVG